MTLVEFPNGSFDLVTIKLFLLQQHILLGHIQLILTNFMRGSIHHFVTKSTLMDVDRHLDLG